MIVDMLLEQYEDEDLVYWDKYVGKDMHKDCVYCGASLWKVWEKRNPDKKWTECGGIGEGVCPESIIASGEKIPHGAR